MKPPQTIRDIIERLAQITYKTVVLVETRAWLEGQFAERDGLVAAQLMLTDDGRAVPQSVIYDTISDIDTQLALLTAEREQLERTQLK
jgi:hypothetical protein